VTLGAALHAADPWLDTVLTVKNVQRWSPWLGQLVS
jgi:hypothetical protein